MSAAQQPSTKPASVDAQPPDVVQAVSEAPDVGPETQLHPPDVVAAAAGVQSLVGASVGGTDTVSPAPGATSARGRAKRTSWDKDRYMCEHKRRKYLCRECGGSQICEHGKVRTTCKECQEDGQGGGTLCEHGRRRTFCKDCGGNALCIHKRQKTTCKECGGSQVCPHNKLKSACKECKGGSICQHGRVRTLCKECKGGGVCSHGREKRKCKDCEKVREEAAETVDRVFKTAVAQCPGYLAVDSMVPPGSKSADEEIAQLELALAVSEAIAEKAQEDVTAARKNLAAYKRRFQENAKKEASGVSSPGGVPGVQAGTMKMNIGLGGVAGAAGDGADMSVAGEVGDAARLLKSTDTRVVGAQIMADGLVATPPPPPPLTGIEAPQAVMGSGETADGGRAAKKRNLGTVAGAPGQPAPVVMPQPLK